MDLFLRKGCGKMKKKRKSKPLRTERGEYFRHINNQILEYTAKYENIKTAQNNLMAYCQKMGKINGVSNEEEKVSNSLKQLTLLDAVRKIDMLQPELEKCLETLHALNAEKTQLILLYNKKEDIESKVFFYREIKGYTQEKTAELLGYCVRQIQRIEKSIR